MSQYIPIGDKAVPDPKLEACRRVAKELGFDDTTARAIYWHMTGKFAPFTREA